MWRFQADALDQTQSQDGYHFATGIRHSVGMEWHPTEGGLYMVQQGRDSLDRLWPELFTAEQNAALPSEELLLVSEGADFGWPYCYHDPVQGHRILAPEYGGDGYRVATHRLGLFQWILNGIRCERYALPLIAFPAHTAPNDLLFYTGKQFPGPYRHGAFITFHGGWGRAPAELGGFCVGFVPFDAGRPVGTWEVFASGFAGHVPVFEMREASHRPMGLAQAQDGSLYIIDSVEGRLWRVLYTGSNGGDEAPDRGGGERRGRAC